MPWVRLKVGFVGGVCECKSGGAWGVTTTWAETLRVRHKWELHVLGGQVKIGGERDDRGRIQKGGQVEVSCGDKALITMHDVIMAGR
jgi:hypothetical protein